jgi:hypothetical protein
MATVGLPYAFRISNQKPVEKFRLKSMAPALFLAVAVLVSREWRQGSFLLVNLVRSAKRSSPGSESARC